MIQSETELYSNKTDFQSVQTNTITMLCLHPNLLYGLTLPMLRKMTVKLDTTSLEYTAEYASNLADNINQAIYNILNYEETQVKKIASGKIFSELAKMPNTINIEQRLSLIDGLELLNINAPLAPEQYASIKTPSTPMIVKTNQEHLVNNNYIRIPVKTIQVDLTKELNALGEVAVTFLVSSGNNLDVVIRAGDPPFVARNMSYEDNNIVLINNNSDDDYLGAYVRSFSSDPLKYSFFYTASELAQILGGKASIEILQSNVIFSGNRTIESLPLGMLLLIFEKDIILVQDKQIIISTAFANSLIGKPFNLTKQSVSISTKSQNVNDVFGIKQVKYKNVLLPVSFIQAGDFLSDVEIITTNKTEATLYEPVASGPRTVMLGTYKRWKQLCKDLSSISYTHKTLEDFQNMNDDVLRTEISRLQIMANSLINLFKTYSFGRLQSFVLKGLNALTDAHKSNNYDVALDDLFNGDLISYTSRTEDDCNSNRYLVNVIKRAIYDLVTT